MHSLAIAGDGRIYVAWLDERNVSPVQDMKMKRQKRRTSHGKATKDGAKMVAGRVDT